MRPFTRFVLASCPILALGCGPSAECRAEVEAFEARLQAIPREGQGLWLRAQPETIVILDDAIAADDVDLVTRPPLFLYATAVGVTGPEGILRTQSVPDAAAGIGALLDDHGGAPKVVLVAQRDAAWEHVAVVLEAIRQRGQGSIDLLFRRSAEVPPAPEPKLSLDLDPEVAPDQRRSSSAIELEAVVKDCAPLVDAIVEIAPLPLDEFADRARTELGKPLLECNCAAEPRALGAILHYLFAPPIVPAVVTLSLPAEIGIETLKFSPNATWAEVHERVIDTRARPVRFAAG
ncbi:hypothetical protein ACNOYE_36515 [Nannocystaceae bacterium ST9]